MMRRWLSVAFSPVWFLRAAVLSRFLMARRWSACPVKMVRVSVANARSTAPSGAADEEIFGFTIQVLFSRFDFVVLIEALVACLITQLPVRMALGDVRLEHRHIRYIGVDSCDLVTLQPKDRGQELVQNFPPALACVVQHDSHSFKAVDHMKQLEMYTVFAQESAPGDYRIHADSFPADFTRSRKAPRSIFRQDTPKKQRVTLLQAVNKS